MFVTVLHILALVAAGVGVMVIDRWLRRPL
jgi:hypothetical protein